MSTAVLLGAEAVHCSSAESVFFLHFLSQIRLHYECVQSPESVCVPQTAVSRSSWLAEGVCF